MKLRKSLFALLMAVVMLVSVVPLAVAGEAETPLVVAYNTFSEKFSPFFADTAYDRDVADMTQIAPLKTDRMGGIVYNSIEGETVNYNGTDYLYTGASDVSVNFDQEKNETTYVIKLREGMKFSDGEPVTADDLIFSYYVFLDPAYTGSTTLNSYPIIGLKDYQTQTSSEVYAKYDKMADDIFAAGRDHVWADTDSWTKEQQEAFWAELEGQWKNDVNKIVDYVFANYLGYAPERTGYTEEEVTAKEELKVVLGMALWGFGTVENKVLTTKSGKVYDLNKEEYPTRDNYYEEAVEAYKGDPVAYAPESSDGSDVWALTKSAFIGEWGPKDETMAGKGVPNVSGIKKLDDYTVEVKTTGYEAPAVYSIAGINVSPLHYYGDKAQYDYENNMFGHPFGDLTIAGQKSTHPMGAGPYKFVKYENRVVYFEANEHYYRGEPKIKFMQFKETVSNEVPNAMETAAIDVGEMSGNLPNVNTIKGFNSNGDITGDKVTTSSVDNLGYGYIGLNADTMLVGDEPASDASKNLRRAYATVLAVYRDVVYDSYYGDAASVINSPISNTSWAAPQPTDPDYKVAFSVNVEGEPIYTYDMTDEQKYEAAVEAAKGFLIAAGFTFDEATGKFTAAPEGAKLSYEIIIPGEGKGDHPSIGVLTEAKAALETIGMELKINDPADSNVLWNALDSGKQEMWTAAWGSTIDPDMYQVYHSSNIVGLGGSDSNHYHIADAKLDEDIILARQSDDQSYRKTVYKEALDIIVDWAVEVPTYQRKNFIIFSTERVNIETLPKDITTFYGWMSEIENLELTAK